MLRCIVRPTIFAFIAFCFTPNSNADIVFDNFDAGGGFSTTDSTIAVSSRDSLIGGVDASRLATRFTVVGGDFTLDSLDLPISYDIDVEGNDVMRVRITEDLAGVPGSNLEILSPGENIWPDFANPFSTVTNLTSSSNPLLENGASYWIVTEPTEIGMGVHDWNYRWFHNTNGNGVPYKQQQATDAVPSGPWPFPNFGGPLAFRVNGTAVPEPGSLLLVGIVATGLLVKRRRAIVRQ